MSEAREAESGIVNGGDDEAATTVSTTEYGTASWLALFALTTRSDIPLLLAGIIVSAVAGAARPAQDLIIGHLFQSLSSFRSGVLHKDEFVRLATKYLFYQLGVASGSWLCHSLKVTLWIAFGESQAKSGRDRLFHVLLKKELEWFDKQDHSVDTIPSRKLTQIRDLQLATAQPLGSLIEVVATAMLSLVQATSRSWNLTLVTLGTVPVIMIPILFLGKTMQSNVSRQQKKLTEAHRCSTRAFAAIQTVQCFNGQKVEVDKYSKSSRDAIRWYAKVANASALQMGLISFLVVSMFVQGFYYGGVLVTEGRIDAGDVVTTFFSVISALSALYSILPQTAVLGKGRLAGASLRTILQGFQSAKPERESAHIPESETFRGAIDIRNLFFTYPSRPSQWVIHNLTMSIPSGRMAFLMGKSGSGKSTIGQLLVRLYGIHEGQILVDGKLLRTLNSDWLRNSITLVQQSSVLFNDTIYHNIALGRKGCIRVTEDEVLEAVDFALLQAELAEIPAGLHAEVGPQGVSVSGGQRQRIALARARLRDSAIVILDEPTSALDHVSRTLVMEAIRRWRRGRTTIIITHDISYIESDDYVYLLEKGQLVQEGCRRHLEKMEGSPFQEFLIHGGKDISLCYNATDVDIENVRAQDPYLTTFLPPSATTYSSGADLVRDASMSGKAKVSDRTCNMQSFQHARNQCFALSTSGRPSRSLIMPTTTSGNPPGSGKSSVNTVLAARKCSIKPAPSAPTFRNQSHPYQKRTSKGMTNRMYSTSEYALNVQRSISNMNRERRWVKKKDDVHSTRPDGSREVFDSGQSLRVLIQGNSFKYNFSSFWRHLPRRAQLYLIFGFWGATIHAVANPVFSFAVSKMLQTYSVPGGDKYEALKYALITLLVAIVNAVHTWMYRFFFEYASLLWMERLRRIAYEAILNQNQDFFEKEENEAARLTACLDRDAEEMRNLLGQFASFGYIAVVLSMVSFGWALIAQWKMTLVAFAASPFVYGVTTVFARISEKWEGKTNDASEAATAIFHEVFANIQTVKTLALEAHFRNKFIKATDFAFQIGLQRSFYVGFFYGLSESAGNFIIAFIFCTGARLIVDGARVGDIIQVFTMLIFAFSNVSSILEWIPQIGSSKDSAARVLRLVNLPKHTLEQLNSVEITHVGEIQIDKVCFAYPSRPKLVVLNHISFRLPSGTVTAVVGRSGSGKSTIANLLLGLYRLPNPSSTTLTGNIWFGGAELRRITLSSLRTCVAVVSQTQALFAETITENVCYGLPLDHPDRSQTNIEWATRHAGIHDFIMSLPMGYQTVLGEGGTGLSGGQTQRIAIARALVRHPSVLILDEATSALDVESASLIRRTIRGLLYNSARFARPITILTITHDEDLTRLADNIVVLEGTTIAEEGSFEELTARNGALCGLLSRGELRSWRKSKSTGKDNI